MSIGNAIVRNLSDRLDQRREFLAEKQAEAAENLRTIVAQRRQSADTARQALQSAADALIMRGFSEDEVSQLVERDANEAIRLAVYADQNNVRSDDLRTAITFQQDYTPDMPLSELIREAAPIFRDVDEPEPAARSQNVFRNLFNMFTLDVEDDMDRFYRESNFGGYSGYDVLGSVGAPDYRERTGDAFVDYGAIPTQLTDTERRDYTNGIQNVILNTADTIIEQLTTEDPFDAALKRDFEGVRRSESGIVDLLFDESDPQRYARLEPYREEFLSQLSTFYGVAAPVFSSPVFGTELAGHVEEYVTARNEEAAAAASGTDTTGDGGTDLVGRDLGSITEDNAQDLLDTVLESDEDTFIVNGVSMSRQTLISTLEGLGAERVPIGVDSEGVSGFQRVRQERAAEREIDTLIAKTREDLATGEYGPGSAPIRRFWRYLTETDQGVLDEAEAIQAATDLLNSKEDEIRQIVRYDEEARRLLSEDPLRFLEEYSEQLSGE